MMMRRGAGRPREDRRVVTYSLSRYTITRIEELREHKQKREQPYRPTRVTFSEVLDDCVRLEYERRFCEHDDPTNGGRFDPDFIEAPKWKCPTCETINVGGWLECPHDHCRTPNPRLAADDDPPTMVGPGSGPDD